MLLSLFVLLLYLNKHNYLSTLANPLRGCCFCQGSNVVLCGALSRYETAIMGNIPHKNRTPYK